MKIRKFDIISGCPVQMQERKCIQEYPNIVKSSLPIQQEKRTHSAQTANSLLNCSSVNFNIISLNKIEGGFSFITSIKKQPLEVTCPDRLLQTLTKVSIKNQQITAIFSEEAEVIAQESAIRPQPMDQEQNHLESGNDIDQLFNLIFIMSKKKPKQAQQDDDSTIRLWNVYRKKCDLNGVPISKLFKQKYEVAIEEGHLEKVQLFNQLQMWEQIGPVGCRALIDSMTQISYKHLKKIRFWKMKIGDQGTRAISLFIQKSKVLEYLDLLDNQVTPLGCQFLGRVLQPGIGSVLIKLKLDHNPFGTDGLKMLAKGLAINTTIQKLSLNYCCIDEKGAIYLQQILANLQSKVISLKVQGNQLMNRGVYELFRALQINSTLQKIKIADNQMNLVKEDGMYINKICEVMRKNRTIGFYDLAFNMISDEDGLKIIQQVRDNINIYRIFLSNHLSKDTQQTLQLVIKKRKPKKKKKNKKKKKPKK